MDLRSAWIPAPPVGSVPAMLRTRGTGRSAGPDSASSAAVASPAAARTRAHASASSRAAASGSSAAQIADTTAVPAPPAAAIAATSRTSIPPIATHGTGESPAMIPNPSCPSGAGWSGLVLVGRITPTPR